MLAREPQPALAREPEIVLEPEPQIVLEPERDRVPAPVAGAPSRELGLNEILAELQRKARAGFDPSERR